MKQYIIVLTLFLSGCVSVFPESGPPAKKVFLSLCPLQKQKQARRSEVLVITHPQAHGDLAGKNIRIIRPGNCIPIMDTIADYEWEEKLPDLIESAITVAVEQSRIFKGVAKSSEWIRGDLELVTEIRHFDVIIVGQPYVEVELAVKVMTSTDHKLVSQRLFRYQEALECITLASILDAYSCAVNQLLIDLTNWLARVRL